MDEAGPRGGGRRARISAALPGARAGTRRRRTTRLPHLALVLAFLGGLGTAASLLHGEPQTGAAPQGGPGAGTPPPVAPPSPPPTTDGPATRSAIADSILAARVEGCSVCLRMTEQILPGMFFEDAHEFACAQCHHPHVRHSAEEWKETCTSCHVRAWNESVMHRVDPEVFQDCTNCHRPHVWTADADDCLGCHGDIHGPAGEVAAGSLPGAGTFPHGRHADLACSACHRSETRHAELLLDDHRVCMDCHHGTGAFAPGEGRGGSSTRASGGTGATSVTGDQGEPRPGGAPGGPDAKRADLSPTGVPALDALVAAYRPVPCQTCHEEGARGGTRRLRAMLELSVWGEERAREVPFDHDRHEGLPCGECHRGAEPRPVVDCGRCHDDHHRSASPCLGCHETPPADAHDLAIHESRSCTGCHEENALLAAFEAGEVSTTRNVCVVCHQDQVEHQPGRDCAGCHRLPVYTAQGGK